MVQDRSRIYLKTILHLGNLPLDPFLIKEIHFRTVFGVFIFNKIPVLHVWAFWRIHNRSEGFPNRIFGSWARWTRAPPRFQSSWETAAAAVAAPPRAGPPRRAVPRPPARNFSNSIMDIEVHNMRWDRQIWTLRSNNRLWDRQKWTLTFRICI